MTTKTRTEMAEQHGDDEGRTETPGDDVLAYDELIRLGLLTQGIDEPETRIPKYGDTVAGFEFDGLPPDEAVAQLVQMAKSNAAWAFWMVEGLRLVDIQTEDDSTQLMFECGNRHLRAITITVTEEGRSEYEVTDVESVKTEN